MRASLRSLSLALSLLAWLLVAGSLSPAAADGFLRSIPDLPLMTGLVELEQEGLSFDNPEGRIVEAYAQGVVGAEAVRSFYKQTLPQLGWRAVKQKASKGQAWIREDERLDIQVVAEATVTTVHFTIRPQD